MNTHREDRELLEAVRGLPRSLPPRRDLWPEISARLSERDAPHAPRRRDWRLALAGSVAVAFAVGLLLGRSWTGGPAPAPPGAPVPALPDPTLAVAAEAVDREYQAAFLGRVPVGSGPAVLGDDAALAIEGSWLELREAETALLTALQEYPNNPYLNHKLIDLRARQLAFLREMQLLGQDYGRST